MNKRVIHSAIYHATNFFDVAIAVGLYCIDAT